MPTLNVITNGDWTTSLLHPVVFLSLSVYSPSSRGFFDRASFGESQHQQLSVSVPADRADSSDVIKTLSSLVAEGIGKSEAFVMVSLRTDVSMCFGGSEAPCAFAELISIGGLNPESNKKLSSEICSVLETKLDVPKNRVYIKFFDVARPFFGYNGSTFG